jgi:hypothetical protein
MFCSSFDASFPSSLCLLSCKKKKKGGGLAQLGFKALNLVQHKKRVRKVLRFIHKIIQP